MPHPGLDHDAAVEALTAWRDAGGNIQRGADLLGMKKSSFRQRLRACTRDKVQLEDGTVSPVEYVTSTKRLAPGWWIASARASVSNRHGHGADTNGPSVDERGSSEPFAAHRTDDPLGLLTPEGEATRAEFATKPQPESAPKGWEPGVVWRGKEGTLCVGLESQPDPGEWDELLTVWDLDPARYCIVGEPEFRAWDTAAKNDDGEIVTKRLFYYKARVGLRSSFVPAEDIDALMASVSERFIPPDRPSGPVDLVVNLADWQLGKGDGDGVEGTVRRALRGIHSVPDAVEELTKVGRAPGRIHIQGMGDLVEQCSGNYSTQQFTTILNRRDQVKIARRLILLAVEECAPLAERVTVSCVPGNHGENRQGGKKLTDDADNDDVAVFEQVADIAARCPELDHVGFVIPKDELQVVLDIGGAAVGFHHGHVAGRGSTPQAKQKRWWADMIFSQSSLENCTLLVTAHYHHFSVIDHGPRWHVQCPTIDGGSKWWQDMGGGHSRAGTLAFSVQDGVPGDWRIL